MIEYQRSLIHDIDSFATIRNRVSSSGILTGESAHLLLYNFRSRLTVKLHILRQCSGRLAGAVPFSHASTLHARAIATKWDEITDNLDYIIKWIDRMIQRRETQLKNVLAQTQLEESRKAILQGDTMKHLTTLAFLYIPISCVSSIFGMNIQELDPGPPAWIFVVVALGVTVLTIMASLKPMRAAAGRACLWLWEKLKAKLSPDDGDQKAPPSPRLTAMYW